MITGLGHIAPYFTFTDFPETGSITEDTIFHGNVSYWEERRSARNPNCARDTEPLGITIDWKPTGHVE